MVDVFNWDKIATSTIGVYDRILKETGREATAPVPAAEAGPAEAAAPQSTKNKVSGKR
ncbi:hypothetical protein D3C86_1983020 [compost metagenome]